MTAARPWAGASPLANAESTRAILAAVESALAAEGAGPVGWLLSVPNVERAAALRTEIANLRGRVALVETTAGGWGEGGAPRGGGEYPARRLGPTFAQDEVAARGAVERSVVGACGIPPALAGLSSGGDDSRESWRQFVFSTLRPVTRLIEGERQRIGLAAPISFDRLAASDLSARSRAFASLTGAGMAADRAATLAGFDG